MPAPPKGGAFLLSEGLLFLSAGSPSQSSRFARCQLPQSGSPWQSTQSSSLCQGLSLWERWHGVSRDGEGEDAKTKSMGLRLFCKLFVNPIDKAGGQEYIFSSRADRVLKTKRTAPQEVRKTMKKNIDTINARLCRRRARSC